jgi:hypothetical protein
MPDTGYSPGGEFIHLWWTERIKPFLNFKQYLAQRREILERPEVTLENRVNNDQTWRSPLQFAIQGTVVPTIILGLLSSVFLFFAGDVPSTNWAGQQAEIAAVITALTTTREVISGLPDTAGFRFANEDTTRGRDDALQEADRRLATVRQRLWVAKVMPHVEQAEKALQKLAVPLTLVLGAYFFKFFLRTGQGRHAVHTEQAARVYLYFVTSAVFWLGLVGTFFLTVTILGARTGKEEIATAGYAGAVVMGLASLVVLNRECRKLSLLFGMPLLEGRRRRKSGHNKVFSTIFYSNLASLIATTLLIGVGSWVWGIGKLLVLSLRPNGS